MASTALPEDLVTTNILPRLPAKSIGRFRCVSKPWRSLLSSPKFIKAHLQVHTNDPEEILLRVNHGSGGLDLIKFSSGGGGGGSVARLMASHPYAGGRRIFQLGPSCEGLVLMLLISISHPFGKIFTVLLNPITRESVDLSNHNVRAGRRFGLGLGYDKFSDDYKVVALWCSGNVEVYSVRSKTWRGIPKFPYNLLDFHNLRHHNLFINGVFVNGYIYWKGGYYRDEKGEKFFVLIAFNLASEEFEKVPLPSGFDGKCPSEICVLDGYLSLVFRNRRVDPVHVWVTKEYGVQDSWTNVAKIEYPEDLVDGRFPGKEFRVICGLHGDEIVTKWDMGSFFSYNLRSEKWRFLDIADLYRISFKEQVTPFRGSLVSLNSREE